jgi:hypothetical protein
VGNLVNDPRRTELADQAEVVHHCFNKNQGQAMSRHKATQKELLLQRDAKGQTQSMKRVAYKSSSVREKTLCQ